MPGGTGNIWVESRQARERKIIITVPTWRNRKKNKWMVGQVRRRRVKCEGRMGTVGRLGPQAL